jgi:acetyl esterase/lipase
LLGSGWVLRGLGQEAAFIRQTLANPVLADYPLTLLDCDYAKSPEWPCPADTEDARDVYDWVLNNPALFDKERITLGGFSAGATIALGLSIVLGEATRLQSNMGGEKDTTPKATAFTHPIKAVFAVYPVVTWEGPRSNVVVPPESKSKPGYLLPLWFSKIVTTAHLFSPVHPSKLTPAEEQARKEELIRRPVVSPARAGVIEDFSPIVVLITAEFDHLTRDTEALRERLRNEGAGAGVKVYGKMVKGVGHGWDEVVKKGKFGHKERVEVYDIGARMIARAGGLDLDVDA